MVDRKLFAGSRPGLMEHPLLTLLLAAGLAVWLLLRPASLQALPLVWRVPVVGLGAWALGMAFVRPLTLGVGRGWLWRQARATGNRLALWGFALLVVGLELLRR